MKHKHPLSHYAKVYSKSERTIGNYSRAGVDLDNPEEVSLHKACLRGSGAKGKKRTPMADDPTPLETEVLADVDDALDQLETAFFVVPDPRGRVRGDLAAELGELRKKAHALVNDFAALKERRGWDGFFGWEEGEAIYTPASELTAEPS